MFIDKPTDISQSISSNHKYIPNSTNHKNQPQKAHVFSIKGCVRSSSAWKLFWKGAASFLFLIIMLLLVTTTLALPQVTTDKTTYTLGEKVMITINNATNNSELKIINRDNIYKFVGELNHQTEFLPQHTGEFSVSLEYDIYKEARTSFTVEPQLELQPSKRIIQGIYTPSVIETSSASAANLESGPNIMSIKEAEGIEISNEWLVIKKHNKEIVEKTIDLYDFSTRKKYSTTKNAQHTPIGPYDTEVRIQNHPIKKIFFRNLETQGTTPLELRIDDLTGNPNKAGTESKQFYVIDPTSLNFTNATVTATAKGEELWKCKDWNYTKQECYGKWEYIMDITPGQNYTFLLTLEDPAYSETTHDADDCYDEYAGGACTADQVTAISANGGTSYTFNKVAGKPVRVSFANQPASIDEVVECTVYVDGYDSDGNTWTLQVGNWSTATWDSAGSGQTAPSPEGEINWDCLSHFQSNSNDDALFDDFAVRITTNDRSRTATAYIDYVYVVINFSIPDTENPKYSAIVANPSSPATFTPSSNTYQFNTTWTDNEQIDKAWIEHNFTGTMTNYTNTPLSNVSSIYYYIYGPIAAGDYAWRTHANDTASNSNNTMPFQNYKVNKTNSQVNLLLNNTDGNFTFNNSGTVNISGIRTAGEADLYLYEDGVQFDTGPTPLNNIRTYQFHGIYNITLRHLASQNYTASSETHFIHVYDTLPPDPVTGLGETATGQTWILWNWTNATNQDLDHVEVWLNKTPYTNVTTPYINITGLLSDTGYEIEVRSVDNWTDSPNKAVFVNDTAFTEISADTTPPVISNVANHSITDSTANITWDTDEPADSIVKYGTSPGIYTLNITDLTLVESHELKLTGLQSGTMYYYVVNSSDAAGNSAESTEYNFTTIPDQTPPNYTNPVASPASPADFTPLANTYQFNTTWTDNEQMDQVWIEHNFTGTMINYTYTPLSNNSLGEYYYNYGPIAAGDYAWRTHANDTASNSNNTMPFQNYRVNKTNSEIDLLLNNTNGNYSINESETANITGIVVTGEGILKLYENGTQINQGTSPITNITQYKTPGTYNISLLYETTQNYSQSRETFYLKVNDTRAPWVFLSDPSDLSTDYDGDVIFKFTVNDTSEVQNCSLYINGAYDQDKEILTKGLNTFTKNGMTNGEYEWYVNCTDHAGHWNISQTWNITIEINLFYPTLTPTECDDEDGCTVTNINNTPETWEEHGTLEKGASQSNFVYVNFSQPNIPAGSTIHWMYVYYDKYQETTEGFIRLEWLNGTDWGTEAERVQICAENYGSSTLHAHDFVNCSFTAGTMPTLDQINNGLQLRAEFYYSGSASGKNYGTDEAYINLKYTEDTTPPTVELVEPNGYRSPGIINFTYIPTDANLVNCTFYEDFDESFGPNITETNVVSGQTENFTFNLPLGYYTWNVYCCDVAGNCAFDEIGGPTGDGNYTVNITNPDLIVYDIKFNTSNSSTREGMNITINATILNQGNVNVTGSFNVSFFIGDPDSGGTQINGNQTITGLKVGENKTVNVTWIIDQGGPRTIYVIVDPPLATNGSIQEINENNNKNNKTIHIPAYNYFYGSVQNNLFLSNIDNDDLYNYLNITTISGNIFITDKESTISFSDLQAISRDVNDLLAPNDFNDTDTALGMTNYNDSIRKIYTQDTDTPIATKTMIIFTNTINNIPIINSTNNTNFQTGILWDKSDGHTQYDGTQDIIFATEINPDTQGKYGTYDYEIRVPVNLKNYELPGNQVVFYWEIES